MTPDKPTVATPTATHERMAAACALPLALMGGSEAMRAAGKLYLPQEAAETDQAYRVRLARTFLYNGFKRAIRSLRGKVLAKPIQLGDGASGQAELWAHDIDSEGRDLTAFCFDVFESALVRGVSYILVDYPRVPPGSTLADERSMGARPYWIHVYPENLIGWRIERTGGQRRLVQARIRECVTEPDGEWGEQEIEQVRVLEPGGARIYRKTQRDNGVEEWVIVDEYPVSLDFIPLVPVYTGRTGDMEAAPPLADLAEKNLEHWQSASDQRHILHVARVPILFGKGWPDDEPVTIGPNSLVKASSDGADLRYVEHSGAAIGAGEVDLERIQEQMTLLSLEPMLPRTGDATATARALDQAEANSALQAWAANLQDALELAFFYAHRWIGQADETPVLVNDDFGLSVQDGQDIEALIKLRMAGDLSRESLWHELKRRGVLDDDMVPEEEMGRIEEEGPALGAMGLMEPAGANSE